MPRDFLTAIQDPRKIVSLFFAPAIKSAYENGALPQETIEQINERFVICGFCVEKGKCQSGCGCPTPDVLFSIFSCGSGEWKRLRIRPIIRYKLKEKFKGGN